MDLQFHQAEQQCLRSHLQGLLYLPVKEFTGAVRVQPQPELPDDMVTVLMADGRTLAVQSVDLYYED